MPTGSTARRLTRSAALAGLLGLVSAGPAADISARSNSCGYDPLGPSIAHARENFEASRYSCAAEELDQLLALDTLGRHRTADAHALKAAIYYVTTRDENQRRRLVRDEFVAAFRVYPTWSGELAVSSPNFRAIMNDARELVQWLFRLSPPQEPAEDTVTEAAEGAALWYRQWWAIATGVGVVAMAVILLTGDPDSSDPPLPPRDTLPGFPPPPE
jgi:hypothetical protein